VPTSSVPFDSKARKKKWIIGVSKKARGSRVVSLRMPA
jgi:hypothetical protein